MFQNKPRDMMMKRNSISSLGGFRKAGFRTWNRRLTTLLLSLMIVFLVYIVLMPAKSSHFESREIKIENLKYGLYDKDQNSFVSKDLENVLEKYEDNREQKPGILSNHDILSRLKNNEKQLNEKLNLLNRPKLFRSTAEDHLQVQRADKSIPTKIETGHKSNTNADNFGDLIDKVLLTNLMKTIEKLSNKIDYVFKKINETQKPETKISRPDKARVLNIEDQKQCNDPTVLFLVTSHSANTKRRQAIRNNWGNQARFPSFRVGHNLTYSVFFSVGLGKDHEHVEKTRTESRKYRDLIIIDREENFYDLTRRVMASFDWAVNHCNFTYVFKLDDDIFINIPNMFAFLSNDTISENKNRLYAGDMNIDAAVNRDAKSKYSVSYTEWPVETYPPYCSGGGFIISRDIVASIVPYFDWVNPYKIDDVYVGMVVQRAKIEKIMLYEPTDKDQFWFYGNSTSCTYIERSMVYHKVDKNPCMESLTMKSILGVPRAMAIIDYFVHKPPSLADLPKANVPKGRRYIPKVGNVIKVNGRVVVV